MRRKVLTGWQLIQSYFVYVCVFFPVTALMERQMFALKGVWPAILTIFARGLVSGSSFCIAHFGFAAI